MEQETSLYTGKILEIVSKKIKDEDRLWSIKQHGIPALDHLIKEDNYKYFSNILIKLDGLGINGKPIENGDFYHLLYAIYGFRRRISEKNLSKFIDIFIKILETKNPDNSYIMSGLNRISYFFDEDNIDILLEVVCELKNNSYHLLFHGISGLGNMINKNNLKDFYKILINISKDSGKRSNNIFNFWFPLVNHFLDKGNLVEVSKKLLELDIKTDWDHIELTFPNKISKNKKVIFDLICRVDPDIQKNKTFFLLKTYYRIVRQFANQDNYIDILTKLTLLIKKANNNENFLRIKIKPLLKKAKDAKELLDILDKIIEQLNPGVNSPGLPFKNHYNLTAFLDDEDIK